jgi:pimeloyl-ACP methyl ester carboxylesterase
MSGESEIVRTHRSSGRTFESGGVESFVREQGEGDPVLCMHGVPASSFLYRKVLAELSARRFRGIAFDLPGLGLAARPQNFDYSWTGLGQFAVAAVDALTLKRFHLVVHDIGGPVGFELAASMPQRIASLTILNTIVAVDGFRRPWSMQPFAIRGLGELWLGSITKPAFRALMRLQGIQDGAAVTKQELDAYLELLKRADGGRAFLKIMRGFERTAQKQTLYEGAVRGVPYPVQVVWGAEDPALKLSVQGEQARRIAHVETVHALPAKHFLQEDQAPALAELIARHAAASANR